MAKTENQVATGQGQSSVSIVDSNNNENNTGNNNKTTISSSNALKVPSGKYQLRPRSLQARRFCESDWSFPDTIRDKPRPQPLSRYRRKTANARERYRMRQINTAFESLRGVLPSWVCSRRAASDLTKITTLRLASAYIRALQDILDGNTSEDSCPWVFSAIFNNRSPQIESQSKNETNDVNIKSPPTPPIQSTSDADLVSLLCSSGTEATSLDDHFDSFSHLSPISDNDPVALLLLGTDPPSSRCWGDGQQVSLVT